MCHKGQTSHQDDFCDSANNEGDIEGCGGQFFLGCRLSLFTISLFK